jgi:hypothetical protein
MRTDESLYVLFQVRHALAPLVVDDGEELEAEGVMTTPPSLTTLH